MKLFLGLVAMIALLATTANGQEYSCSIEKKCNQMRSCSEAVYQFRVCGYSKRDGDNDGIPCEAICGKTKARMNALLDSGM